MDLQFFVQYTGAGVMLLVSLVGVLVLVLPGRLDLVRSRTVGLGRQVEALIILSFITTATAAPLSNVPVWVNEKGLVAFSLIGALIPVLLSIRFLVRAGLLRGLLALVGVGLAAATAYATSRTEENLGIVSEYPVFFLPSLVAASAATAIAPRSLHAVPLAYAMGSLGALVGADLVRLEWVLDHAAAYGGSFGGAAAVDLVFLGGVWAAAMAAVPLWSYWGSLRRPTRAWDDVADVAARGESRRALEDGVRLVESALPAWARVRGLAGLPLEEVRQRSYAEPVLRRASWLVAQPFVPPDHAKPVLEQLKALHSRLVRPVLPDPAARGKRLAAGAIDLVIPVALAIVAGFLVAGVEFEPADAEETPEERSVRQAVVKVVFVLWLGVALHVLYPAITESLWGRTIGKALVGLRVLAMDGTRATGWQCLVRNLGRLLDVPLLYAIAFAASREQGHQRLGDYFGETVVVDDRATARTMMVTTSPTPMAVPATGGTAPTSRYPR